MFVLEQGNIQISKKRLAVYSIKTTECLLLINKWAEPDDVKKQLDSELDFNEEWTL